MSLFDDEPGQATGPKLYPANALAPGNEQNLISGIPGHLLMVWATGYIENSPTKYSKPGQRNDVVVVDIVDLDLPDDEGFQGAVFRQTWWRGGRLIQFLKPKIGRERPVLARMTLGVNTMGKPPYELDLMTHDAECVARAEAWFTAHRDFKPTGPYKGPDDGQPPVQREMSQLERFAAQAAQGPTRSPHQQQLRDLLPPARPASQELDPPF